MSYPQLNSGASTSFPGMMTLSGSSQFAPADITQSLRSARSASPSPREIMTRTTPATTASITTRASKSESQSRAREKRHGCWMCEKSFDRPSTLRKHLLVHTGVKAFVCETCGRRFGVASNLNRHIKRCVLKPVNLANRASQSNVVDRHPSSNGGSSVESPSTSAGGTNVPESSTSPAPLQQSIKRARVLEPEAPEASEASTHSSTPSSSAAGTAPPKPPTKRRRRAPSPSLWVPQSLARYNILPIDYPPTSVPLPPVSPARDPLSNDWIEERNSWDEDVAAAPYHPCGWKGVLPGPGFVSGVKDSSDGGLVNNGAYVMGRLVMV
ncbi:hypothetical protein M404DRAFT_16752 [Pisolithus tinctorius Marx 270]|uniref:pH-response transcription factor pacC/RIM101 n=2 Tax=Pisolithus tinctorius Marx 270 TaxID=870435 RepID=A0A0C3N8M3_PISTI|nr:hypothetical protein M404DRAFT_16752 [Pisolithus tinctorius Marx 270]